MLNDKIGVSGQESGDVNFTEPLLSLNSELLNFHCHVTLSYYFRSSSFLYEIPENEHESADTSRYGSRLSPTKSRVESRMSPNTTRILRSPLLNQDIPIGK